MEQRILLQEIIIKEIELLEKDKSVSACVTGIINRLKSNKLLKE